MIISSIVGKRICLRKAKISDETSVYSNIWSDEDLLRYTVWMKSSSLEEAKDRLLRNIAYQQKNPYVYFVTEKDSDEVIGFGGIMENGPKIYGEAGLCIAKKWQGKGYGKELLEILLDLAFVKLGAESFLYTVYKDNIVSKNLCFHYPFRFLEYKEVPNIDNRNLGQMEVYCLNRADYFATKK